MASWSEPPASVEDYIKDLSPFARPLVERIRKVITSTAPDLDEAIRWNCPSYKGKLLVCGFSAFQKHVSLTFWRGADLPDPKGILAHGQGKTAMRTAKFTAPEQVNDTLIRDWVQAAVALDRGDPLPQPPKKKEKPKPAVPPPALANALSLKKNAKARAGFIALSPSCQREYCEWIEQAKQETTIQRRVEKALEKLSMGEGLNDKYKTC